MKINYSKQAIKFLSKQDKPTRIRIVDAINKLPQGDVKNCRDKEAIDFELEIIELFLIKMVIYYILKKSIIAARYINKEICYECC